MESGKQTDDFSTDFNKAFNSVNHSILIDKLIAHMEYQTLCYLGFLYIQRTDPIK